MATAVVEWDWAKAAATFRRAVPVAKSLCTDKQGNLLVGTDNGLYIVGSNRTVDHILHDARVGESLAGDAVWSLFRDRDDNIWIGTNSGISMVADNDLLVAYPLPSLTGSGMGNQLFCICSDPQGRYWMGGSNGLICIENLGKENQTVRWYTIDSDHYPIPHNRIRSVFANSRQQVWVGGDGGLFLLNEGTMQLKRERQERAELLARAKEKERQLLSDNERLAEQLRLQLLGKSGDESELTADERFLVDITRIIEENMDDSELSVNTLSQKSGISTKQLYRRIKALTGMPVVAYIRDQRLKKAASLLATGNFTVSEVMYMVGFSSASYFTRCFREEYGVTPSAYNEKT